MSNKKEKAKVEQPINEDAFAFGKENYVLFIASIVMIVVGYLLMAGGKSESTAIFNEEIFSFRRITLAPVIVIAGYTLGVFAIVKKAK